MWYKITDKYNKVKYKQGGWNPDEGLDCISMIVLFMKDMGKDVVDFINDDKGFLYKGNLLTASNFLEYLKDPKEISDVLMLFIQDVCVKVDKMIKGDLCFFKYKKLESVGIYLGQGTVMCSFEHYGCRKIKIRDFMVSGIYRWMDEGGQK